ncbi:MAG TPA: hypothetical protein VMY35_09700, partial [Phycisphaerae bacterium]|nr:hypothetical protein [Phycisphaerae bacterium]
TCDVAGDLELGGNATGLTVTTSAAVNLNADMNIRALSTGANVTCAAPRTATVGAGGYTMTNGTLTGTLNVDLSAGAGAYAQNSGTIADGAVLNVTTGTGAITFTALTKTGSGALNVTMAESANIGWNAGVASAATNRISLLTVNSGKTATLTADVDVSALAGSGTVATSSGKDLRAAFLGDNFWTFTGSVTGAGRVWFYAWANTSNAAAITVANSSTTNLEGGNGLSCTLSGRLTTSGALNVNGTGGSNVVTWTLNGGSNIGGAVTVGSTTQSGILVFGPSQVHVLASTLAMSGTGVSNAVTIGGRLILGGTMTGTGIVVAVAGDGEIDCGGTARVTATTVTGRRLVVRRAVDAAGMPLRSWEGGASNVNIMFKGRKEIGAPGVN